MKCGQAENAVITPGFVMSQDIGETSPAGRGRRGPLGPPLPKYLVPGAGKGCSMRRVPWLSKARSEASASTRQARVPKRVRLTWNRIHPNQIEQELTSDDKSIPA